MLRSRLFWKLLLTFSAVNLLAAVALMRISLDWLEQRAYSEAEIELSAAAALMERAYGDSLGEEPSNELQQDLMNLGKESGFRLTLIDAEGRVLADSAQTSLEGVLAMENHGQRDEVVEALGKGQGVGRRRSSTLEVPFVYLARRYDSPDGAKGIVRAALPVQAIQQQVDYFRKRLMLLGLATGAALLAATYLVVRHIVRPVLELNEAANAISRGEYAQRAFVPNRDELGALAQSFNRMSSELDAQFSELHASGQRQATVLGGMVEGVLAIDHRQYVVLANQAAARLLGFGRQKIEGRPLIEVIRDHNLQAALGRVLESGSPERMDLEWQGADRLLLSVQITPLPGNRERGAVIVLHDTTELRRLETLRQEFVANVSHELKTPLSSIKAYTETLLRGAINDEQHAMQFLGRIDEQADRLTALIQDMLSLARIESAQQQFEIINVMVGEAAAACLEDYAARAETRRIELLVESDDPQLEVTADPEGLRVILNNLVDNAIKYTTEGGRVTLRWRGDQDGQVRIEVSDTGIGIPKDELPRVFERFHRVDKARSRELGGTGLGLSIVKHLAQSFGGKVAVESRVDQGSTFAVTLPGAGSLVGPPNG